MKKQFKIQRLHSLIGRFALFTFCVSLLLFELYLLGNYQKFLDSTQILILELCNIFVIINILVSNYYLILIIITAIRNNRFYIIRFILCFISLLFSLLLLFGLKFLKAWF